MTVSVTRLAACCKDPLVVFPSETVKSDLLHKYQSKDDILILTVRVAVIVAVILTVPVLFFTVSQSSFYILVNADPGTLETHAGKDLEVLY